MSILSAPPAGAAAEYNGKDNYYVDGDPERVEGSWFGKGALALGLEGAVDPEDFENVLAGRLPNGVTLGKKVGDDLIHHPGDDLTFSMPKSAGLLATIGGDTRILDAYQASVKDTLRYIERRHIETRAKERGVFRREKTGKITAALFQHDTSRNLDPQPHIHAVVANATERRDGQWRSVDNRPLYRNAKLFTQIQSAYFARELTKLGYGIEWKDTPGHLEIEGVPREVIEHFSTRSQDIQRAFETLDHRTPAARAKIALTTRPAKTEVARDALMASWLARAETIGFDPKPIIDRSMEEMAAEDVGPEASKDRVQRGVAGRVAEAFKERLTGKPRDRPVSPAPAAVESALRQLSEREHAFSLQDIQKAALAVNMPGVVIDGIDREIAVLRGEGELLTGAGPDALLTTKDALDLEKETIAEMRRGFGKGAIIRTPRSLEKEIGDTPLNQGQRMAVKQLLSSPDRVVGVQGYAGTGKTFMLSETIAAMGKADELAKGKGYELFGLAPSNSAVSTLKEEAGVEGWTLQGFLTKYRGVAEGRLSSLGRQKLQKEWGRRLVVVDESSLASTSQVRDLLVIAREIGIPKLALIGDKGQLGSVEAGKAFELLQAHGLPIAQMDEIRRQREGPLRKSVYAAIDGKVAESFALLDDRIIEAPGREAETAAKLWSTLPPEKRANTLVISQSNAMRRQMNEAMRAQLKSEGRISGLEIEHDVLRPTHLTKEESRFAKNYKPGDQVEFRLRRGVRKLGISQGDRLVVKSADEKQGEVTLIDHKGREKLWAPAGLRPDTKQNAVESFRPFTIKLQPGDRVKWTRSDPNRGYRTSETATVVGVAGDKLTLETPEGDLVSLDKTDPMAASLDYAYAITANEAQGKTSERAIGVVDSKERSLSSRRRFYVQISRAKSDLSMVVDDKEAAVNQIERLSGDKTSAIETMEPSDKQQAPESAGFEQPSSPEPTPQLDLEMDRS